MKNKNKGIKITLAIVVLAATIASIVSTLIILDTHDLDSEFDSKDKSKESKTSDKSERKYTILKRYNLNHPRYATVQRDNI
jgi:mannitol-specific phosphotransferase system IIBC component